MAALEATVLLLAFACFAGREAQQLVQDTAAAAAGRRAGHRGAVAGGGHPPAPGEAEHLAAGHQTMPIAASHGSTGLAEDG